MEDEFIKSLPKDDKVAYQKEVRKIRRELKKKYKTDRDDYTRNKKRGIEDDRKHRAMINSCIVPFFERGWLRETGYKFIRASPLLELNVINVDFLLFKESEKICIAIFGEAKGSISSPAKIISQSKDRIKEIEKNSEYIKEKYLKLPENANLVFEHVIAVPDHDSTDTLNKAIEDKGGVIVWHSPVTGKEEISISTPSTEIDNDIRKSMMHRDHDLTAGLKKARTSRKMFNVFPQGHTCSKLCTLTSAIEITEDGQFVTEERLWNILSQELFYLEDEMKNKEMDWIIEQGIKINFLEKGMEPGVYKVLSSGKSRKTLEKSLEKKWIKKSIQEDLESEIEEGIVEIRSRYTNRESLDKWV